MGIYGNKIEMLYEDAEISPEQINELSDYLNRNCINESSDIINEAFNVNDILNNIGLASGKILKINKDIAQLSTQVANTIKTKGINKESKDIIVNLFIKFYKNIGDILSKTDFNIDITIFGKDYNIDRAKNAFLIFWTGCTITTIINKILILILGTRISGILTAVIIAPISEEIQKQLAIKKGCTAEYTIIFNTYEFTSYVSKFYLVIGLKNIIKTRLMVVGMHLTSTIIQFLTNNKEIQKKLHLEKEESKERLSLIGHILGLLIHVSWNYSATFPNSFKK